MPEHPPHRSTHNEDRIFVYTRESRKECALHPLRQIFLFNEGEIGEEGGNRREIVLACNERDLLAAGLS